jgi:glyoxylase-like metal-dependent hydrolase (beta-lactamase superfamily II)
MSSKIKKILFRTLFVLTFLLVITYYFGLVFNGSNSKDFVIDINQIRALAISKEGQLPSKVQSESILKSKTPLALEVTGGDWTIVNNAISSIRVVYPDNKSYIVDTAYDSNLNTGQTSLEDLEANKRIINAMDKATGLLVTHEHEFHIGNILNSKNTSEYLKKSIITKEQFQNQNGITPIVWPSNSRPGFVPLVYNNYHLVAPGIVLIKAPGNTVGSQLVYIKQQNGKEIMLLGGTAWRQENVTRAQAYPYLISLLLFEDREATLGQVKALNKLKLVEPTINMVGGHDYDDLLKFQKDGTIQNKFND